MHEINDVRSFVKESEREDCGRLNYIIHIRFNCQEFLPN